MSRISSAADWLLKLPLIWGTLACLSFYMVLGTLDNPFLNRYFGRAAEADLGNLILLSITAMFFVGSAALVMRLAGLVGQLGVMHRRLIDPKTPGGQSVDDTELMLAQLGQQPSYLQNTYMIRRLRHALEQVRRKQSADTLEEDLRRLEEADYQRMATGYGITKIIVWAIPILGFLGTVIGITLAIGKLSPEELERSLDAVTAGLSVAFDTTAAALALSLVLTFLMFFVKGREEQLLTEVDDRTIDELVGRFQHYGGANDPTTGVVKQMCEHVIRAVETATARQVDLWAEAINETHTQWSSVTAATTDTLKESLTEGLQSGLRDHATGLTHGVESQLSELNKNMREQSTALTTHLSEQAEAFTGTLAERVDALGGDTENLLGNLRQGLERMAELLVEALQRHGETLTRAEEELASENRRHLGEVEAALGEAMVLSADRQEKLIGSSETLLKEMQQALVGVAGATVDHQEQMVRQGEVLLKVVESTSQIRQLEEALNSNLDTLSRTNNFEETLLSLSAAIQLLVARVGGPQKASLKSNTKSQAA